MWLCYSSYCTYSIPEAKTVIHITVICKKISSGNIIGHLGLRKRQKMRKSGGQEGFLRGKKNDPQGHGCW